MNELVEGWAKERSPAAKTLYEWRRVIKSCSSSWSMTTRRWKTKLVNAGHHPKTIRDAKLAPVRTILQRGVDNDRLSVQAAARVTIDVKTKALERKLSFNDKEAKVVLISARKQDNPVLRWVPWLGAYTGARVAELCQLRREDVLQVDDVWCLRITAEAGSVKTLSSERLVALHSALIAEGFVSFVQGIPSGPLFSSLSPNAFGTRGGNGAKMIGRWIRSLGISDERISPTHSWRHRLKTLGKDICVLGRQNLMPA